MIHFIKGARLKVAFVLLCAYVFMITLGILQRSYGDPSGLGVSSVLMIAIISLLLPETAKKIRCHKILQMWLILVIYLFLVTMIVNPATPLNDGAYKKIGGLLILCFFCGAVASMTWNVSRIQRIGSIMLSGLILSGSMALLDDFKIVDISFMNLCYMHTPPIKSPNAQFGHRSVMGLYLGTMLPFLFAIEDSQKRKWFRYATIFVGICFFYMLINSGNRSGFGACAISLMLYYVFHLRDKDRLLNQYVPSFAISIILSFGLVFCMRPIQGFYFVYSWFASPFFAKLPKIGNILAGIADSKLDQLNTIQANVIYSSDMVRAQVIKNGISGLKIHFFGGGFQSNPHIWFVFDIIFAAGIVGIIWCCISSFYVSIVFQHAFKAVPDKKIIWVLLTPLTSWLLVGVMYNSLHLGLAWLFFGIVLALCKEGWVDNMKSGMAKS